jgi:hypothetical protein
VQIEQRFSPSECQDPHGAPPGEEADYDTHIYRWFAERLAAALAVSKKMAENAGSIWATRCNYRFEPT